MQIPSVASVDASKSSDSSFVADDSGHSFHEDNTIPHAREGFIFVFGSNLGGAHGKGAAKVAKVNFGAVYGVGEGPTGRSYAIPTKDKHLKVLSLERIQVGVDAFLSYARERPNQKFFITRVGCGLAGYSDQQIAPMFSSAPLNCNLPREWMDFVERKVASCELT